MRIGVTGHVRLTAESTGRIYTALADALREYPVAEGVTCLAGGADQLFARAILARKGSYDVVLPAHDYRAVDIAPDNLADFDELLNRARRVSVLSYETSDHESYTAASRELLSRCDILIAVWDQDSDGRSSHTARVVETARQQGMEVVIVWPQGAERIREPEPGGSARPPFTAGTP